MKELINRLLAYWERQNIDAPEALKTPPDETLTVTPSIPTYSWETPKNAFHSTRVICDEMNLTLDEKNTICACIFQESMFKNTAKNENKVNGKVVSTDWGLCQINDHYHIGKGKDFISVEYVLNNPEQVVRWMIKMYKHGLLKLWVSYSSGAYKKWLSTYSPMWLLR